MHNCNIINEVQLNSAANKNNKQRLNEGHASRMQNVSIDKETRHLQLLQRQALSWSAATGRQKNKIEGHVIYRRPKCYKPAKYTHKCIVGAAKLGLKQRITEECCVYVDKTFFSKKNYQGNLYLPLSKVTTMVFRMGIVILFQYQGFQSLRKVSFRKLNSR